MKWNDWIKAFASIGILMVVSSCNKKVAIPETKEMTISSVKIDTTTKKEYKFPEDWLGTWTGELDIYNVRGLQQSLPMSLELSETDSSGLYRWAIVYGRDSTAQKRDYQLIEVDKSKGHYIVDEKNGIVLDAYHMQNELTLIFEVMTNNLITTYRLEGEEMVFTVRVFPTKEVRISGDTLINEQKIPKVLSYQHTVNQVARLNKKCLVE